MLNAKIIKLLKNKMGKNEDDLGYNDNFLKYLLRK